LTSLETISSSGTSPWSQRFQISRQRLLQT
jgi:hypothetical protein